MKFNPIESEEEVSLDELSDELFPEGEYGFRVKWAKSAISKSHNDMIKLVIYVSSNGKTIKVYDYLLEAMAFKLKHFCEATGLEKEYANGALSPQMCVGKSGRCTLIIQHDEFGKYPDKNVVKDYCTDEEEIF